MAQDDVTYRCLNAGCGRAFPRRVNFCPWCGAAQQAASAPVAPRGHTDRTGGGEAAPMAVVQPASTVAPLPPPPEPAPVARPLPQPAPAPRAPVPPPPPAPAPAAASKGLFGSRPGAGVPPGARSGGAAGAAVDAPGRAPSRRRPVRLRWWIIALGALWLAWLAVKPSKALIERRMDKAVALAKQCKAREAQDELIALRSTRATPEQLRQVQKGLNDAAAACTRAERRREAWFETRGAVEKLLKTSSYDKARARLSAFTRRWGENEQTRELKKRIDEGRRQHPLADPSRGASRAVDRL